MSHFQATILPPALSSIFLSSLQLHTLPSTQPPIHQRTLLPPLPNTSLLASHTAPSHPYLSVFNTRHSEVLQEHPTYMSMAYMVVPSSELWFSLTDTDEFYGIVFPASIDRQESTDVNIYAITNQQDIVTDICGNLDVCPYDRRLPPLHSTPLICEASSQSYGQRHKIPKPTRQSRDRFGSYVISAAYDPEQRIPVFVLPISGKYNSMKIRILLLKWQSHLIVLQLFTFFKNEQAVIV